MVLKVASYDTTKLKNMVKFYVPTWLVFAIINNIIRLLNITNKLSM